METIVRSQFIGEVKDANPTSQLLTLTISTEGEDRDGDVILSSGWDLKSYKKNPVVLFAHRYDMPAVGKANKIWVEDSSLRATVQFAPTAFGQELWALYAGGFMRAASVGFMPLEEPQEREPKRPGGGFCGRSFLYSKQELLEFSLVPVPSNPEALVTAREAGLSMAMVEKAVCGALPEMRMPTTAQDHFSALEPDAPPLSGSTCTLEGLEEDRKTLVELFPSPLTKGPISYASAHPNGTPKADEDVGWDAGAELRDAEGAGQLRRMHAWIDSEADPETKGAYKLPHHTAAGILVWRGVAAAMGALMGARGGVDIPEGDMPGCHAHLGKHYGEFDREAPPLKEIEGLGLKPFPNEHACRLRNPNDFQEDSFRRVERESDGKPYGVIMGRLKGETTMTEQSYRYPTSDWTVGEARKHCKGHDGILFEPAKVAPAKIRVTVGDMADELDYLLALLSSGLQLPKALVPVAKEVMEMLKRDIGDDTAVEDKSGAVLNRKNKEALKQAQDLIQQVLDSAEPQLEGVDPDRVAVLVAESLSRKLGG